MGLRKRQNTWYKYNPIFIREGALMILRRNYKFNPDSQEIDSKLSIGENIHYLLSKFGLFIKR